MKVIRINHNFSTNFLFVFPLMISLMITLSIDGEVTIISCRAATCEVVAVCTVFKVVASSQFKSGILSGLGRSVVFLPTKLVEGQNCHKRWKNKASLKKRICSGIKLENI